MIARFSSLKGLGVFLDYAHAADVPELRKHNLIYGFNGSGKTTLSRVLASLGLGALRAQLPADGVFEVELADGTRIKSSGALDTLKGRLIVFNVDFIEENLKWKDGTANPVFYIGRPQAEAAQKLEKVDAELRDLTTARASREKESEKAVSDLNKWKRDKAREIADATVSRNYAAPGLITDFGKRHYTEADQVPHDEMTALLAVVNQQAALPKVPPVPLPTLGLATLVAKSRQLLGTTLGELAVEELRQHSQMVTWVKQGLEYHARHKVENCLFCSNKVSKERLDLLAGALDARLDQLNADLVASRRTADGLRDRILGLQALPSKNDVSADFQAEFSAAADNLREKLTEARTAINKIVELLDSKASAPSAKVEEGSMLSDAAASELDASLTSLSTQINAIITRHNDGVDKFEQGKEVARTKIKSHHLATNQASYTHLERVVKEKKTAMDEAGAKQAALAQQAEDLRREVRTHGQAEKIINSLVRGYLGHKELQIKTLASGYQILRNGMPITSSSSLSEGEKTAIALCYFLSTLEAEGRKCRELIVVVDDPISSLDTRALHYAFGLIKHALQDAGQLIIMTHNLHFMNEVKKWLKRRAKSKEGEPATAALLYIETKQDPNSGTRTASISSMPALIREYESEYQFLFHLTLRFMAGEEGYHYLMPNALRKILEIFLAFKLPGYGLEPGVQDIAKEYSIPPAKMTALERLVQLESHADNLEDLVNLSPMTVEAAKQAAEALIDMMRVVDPKHLDRMANICRVPAATGAVRS